MTQKFKLIDAAVAAQKLNIFIGRTKRQLFVVREVIATLGHFHEGANINWHLAKKLRAVYPGLKISLDNTTHSWYELEISGEGFDTISLNLCYKSEPAVIKVGRITELAQRYLLDDQRLPVYEKELTNIEERVERYNKALLELKAAHENLGTGYFTFTDDVGVRVEDLKGRWL